MKKLLIIFAGFGLTTLSTVNAMTFTDQTEIPSWAEESINLVQEENIMTGFGDGSFQPKKILNRAEAVVLIARIKAISNETKPERLRKISFPDVPLGAWFEEAVIYSAEQGWVKGFPDGKFHPEKELNKAELVVLLQRVFELESDKEKIPQFSDTTEESWYKEAVLALYNNDLLRHGRAYKFFPDNKVSRAEAAWVFAEILRKPRLLGTSAANNFEETGRKLSSRRVAIRNRNLNINKQGYEIKKDAIYVNVYDKIDPAEIIIGSDWVEAGNVVLDSTLNDRVKLDNISFKINFDSGVGPARNFVMKMRDEFGTSTEIEFQRNGTAEILDWGIPITPEGSYKFTVFVKSKDTTGFYPNKGKGTLYLNQLSATGIAAYIGGTGDNSYNNYKKEPIVYESRNFRDIEFNPVIE